MSLIWDMCFSLRICEVGKGGLKEGENENIEMILESTTEVLKWLLRLERLSTGQSLSSIVTVTFKERDLTHSSFIQIEIDLYPDNGHPICFE